MTAFPADLKDNENSNSSLAPRLSNPSIRCLIALVRMPCYRKPCKRRENSFLSFHEARVKLVGYLIPTLISDLCFDFATQHTGQHLAFLPVYIYMEEGGGSPTTNGLLGSGLATI